MFRQVIKLDVKGTEDRVYSFECNPSSPLGEIHDALETMKLHVLEKIKEHEKPEEEKEEVKEEELNE